ncbi:MAG: hypothetical protein KKA73_11340 [Chloroflexi bacterium]|nr:hypothetical protein [Chloroflexota bacterium]MBU1748272.1 hypothetical protein [Chloroflexota bacterium]
MKNPLFHLDPNLILIICAAILVSAALLSPNFFLEAHDARHSAYFLMQFDQDVHDGGIPPRWSNDSNYGYGYCVFVLYPPLAFIVGEALHLLGLGFVDAIKGVYALGFLFSGLTMYWFARRWLGSGGALVAALIYMVAPYHLVDIYVRGALAEFTAFALFPWALAAFHDLVERPSARHVALAALSYGLVVLTHMAALLMFTVFLGAYILFLVGYRTWQTRQARGWRPAWSTFLTATSLVAIALLLALALSAGFWLSMLEGTTAIDQGEFIVARADWRRFFVYFDQFFSPFWGYGYAGDGHSDDMSYQLGVVGVVLGLLSLWATSKLTRLRGPARAQTTFFAAATVVLLLLMMTVSAPLWQLAGSLAFTVQFPWRLLTLSSLTLAFLAGAAIVPLSLPETPGRSRRSRGGNEDKALPRLAPLALVIVLASTPYIVPQWTAPIPITPRTLVEFELSHHEILGTMRWTQAKPTTSPMVDQYLAEEPLVKGRALSDDATAETLRVGGHSADFRVQSSNDTGLLVYTQYFPGWSAWIDGQPAPVSISDPDGLIVVDVPPGEHLVQVRLVESPARLAGDGLSAIGLVIAIALLVVPFLKRKP